MALRLSIHLGFVTNSSSMIHHFPPEVLQDPDVRQFLEVFQIAGGFVGRDMGNRSQCGTVAIDPEQKALLRQRMGDSDLLAGPDTSVVVVYGDEYRSLANSLAQLMRLAAEKLGLPYSKREFN